MQAHNLDASSGEVYETDLLIVDIKPEIYAQTVYSTSQNPHDVALGRKLFSPLEIDVTQGLKQINHGSVRYYLHMQQTTKKNCSIVDPSWAHDEKLSHPQQSNLINL